MGDLVEESRKSYSSSPEAGASSQARSSSSSVVNTAGNITPLTNEHMSIQQLEDSHARRKRKRLTISCLTCRKRKIKCDRQKPCSSCIKNNVPSHLCVYDESPWVSSLIKDNKMTNELMNLKQENEHLTGLLRMNEQELNNLRNLLVDLKLNSGAGNDSPHHHDPMAQSASVSKLLQNHFQGEERKESLLLDQPINIGQFSCFKQTKFLVKIFGPSSWQNFVLDDLKTSYMLDSTIPYIMDLISRNERRKEQAKIVKLRLFNESKIDNAKLKEIESYLGDYDSVLKNVTLFCSVHKYTDFCTYLDDDKLMYDFNNIIHKNPMTNNCNINIDLEAPEAYIELANLATLLLVSRIAIIFQDDSFELDKDERLVSYAAHLFSSMMILEQPTVPAIIALAVFQSYQVYNPLDFGAEIIPHGTSRDWSMCLTIAINSALKLGLHTKVPSQYERNHYNYISPHHLREFWRSITFMDFVTSFQNGLPFSMTGYCDITDDEDSILAKQIDNDSLQLIDVITHRKISTLRSVGVKFSTANQNHSKMSLKRDLAKDVLTLKKMVLEVRLSNESILKVLDPYNKLLIQDLLMKVVSLDVLISVTYTLYLSFSDPDHVLNSNIDKSCFAKWNNADNFNLLKRYYNGTLSMVIYSLRLSAWFFDRVYTDPFWSKNLVLQFLVLKQFKQLCLKSFCLLLIMFIRNTKVFANPERTDKFDVQFQSYFNQAENIPVDAFNMPFGNLESFVWSPSGKYEIFNLEDENTLKKTVDLTMKLFKTISSQKSFLTIDRKWYIAMELCYTSILFCFNNCSVVRRNFDYRDFNNHQDFATFKKFFTVDDVNFFRKQNYQKNKNEIMKVTSLLN